MRPILTARPFRAIDAVYVILAALLIFGSVHLLRDRQPGLVKAAVRSADPTVSWDAIRMTRAGPFRDIDGSRPYRLALWCGSVEGRADGEVAVVFRRGKRLSGGHVREFALGWDDLDARGRWLLSECHRLT